MFEQLEPVVLRYEELDRTLADPSVVADSALLQKLMKERAELTPTVETYQSYLQAEKDESEALLLLRDASVAEYAKEELEDARKRKEVASERLAEILAPKDPNDDRNVFLEIRAGAGGDEAALFAGILFRMYQHYAEKRGWTFRIVSVNESELGGFKEVVAEIDGKGAYSRLKFESGVHRVQRVPVTESSGRIHTSTCTVAVMPEADEVEVEIRPEDLRIDLFRSSGAGGQHVNKTESAVRITHLPTGIVVSSQDERSQIMNRAKGMQVLRARLYERMLAEQNEKTRNQRQNQVGTGDRSEKIRTYNYPQSRITDHRIDYTVYRMDDVLNGDLDFLIDLLIKSLPNT